MSKQNETIETESHAPLSGVSGFNLADRKGRLIISRQLILDADEQTLKEIFSNFFPVATEPSHEIGFWDSIMYYGVSPHFDVVDKACIAPQYDVILTQTEDGVKFEKMAKRDYFR